MPNPIKYSTDSESDALKKGNMHIGTGAVGKGPSDVTGYYQGPNVPSNGYVIYMNKEGAPGNLSYHSAANDSQLISFTNNLAGTSYTSVTQCFDYYYGQTDKVLVNQDYPADYPYIVMDGLIFYFDAGILLSYSGSGTVWNDISGLSSKNVGSLINGPTFNTNGGGSIVFDGTDDSAYTNDNLPLLPYNDSARTIMYWIYPYTISNNLLSQIAGYGLDNGSGNLFCGIIWSNGKAGLWGNSINYESTHTVNTNVWQHITYVKTPGTIKCYKNGVSDNGGSLTLNTVASSRPFMGIVYQKQIYGYYNGELSVFQIYNRALTASEVLQNYNAQKGRFGL